MGRAEQGAELLASLPSLPTGTGWFWAPELGILKKTTFPKITTYDSSKAPDVDQGEIVLARIDLPAIQARLETVAKEAVENDPKRLRARIAELEKAKGGIDAEALRKAEEAAERRGKADGYSEAIAALRGVSVRLRDTARALIEIADGIPESIERIPTRKPIPVDAAFATGIGEDRAKIRQVRETAARKAVRAVETKATSRPIDGITAPQQRILDAMAKLESLGVERMAKGQAAAFAGASPKSSSFLNNVSRLRTLGLIDYPRSGEVCLTEAGTRAASYPAAPPTVADLHAAWLRLLSGPRARILECAIAAYPDSLEKAVLADRAGASVQSSSFLNNVSALRSLRVLDYPEKGFVVATEALFPKGVAA
jgi:hypothetical protein